MSDSGFAAVPTEQPPALRLVETDGFPIRFVSELAELESWRKEVYRPVYHIHKWWANRLGSVFRAIILASILPEGARLEDAFYDGAAFPQVTVLDPFMGSGTTVGEAHKLGCVSLGRDINPVACESVRVALGPLDRDALVQAFARLSSGVGEELRRLYKAPVGEGAMGDVLYYFWVKVVQCPACEALVDLFPNYIFARNAYPNRKPEVRVVCPQCGAVFAATTDDEAVVCPECQYRYDPHVGPASGTKARCSACNHQFAIARAVQAKGVPPDHRLFAKLALTQSGTKIYLPATPDDMEAYGRCTEELGRTRLPLPSLSLEDGYNTRQALNYCYRQWRDFFNDRQLLALGMLHRAILDLPDDPTRDALLTVFSGTLEFSNMFASYKGEGTGAVRHMFSHHILKPERVPIEANVWGTDKSSGSFSTLFRSRLLRALDYRDAPFEVSTRSARGITGERKVFPRGMRFTGSVSTDWPPPTPAPRRSIFLSCGSSERLALPDQSIDLVVTDPPFFDNVHYSELADFFHAWQQLRPSHFGANGTTTRHPREVQDADARGFSAKLQAVLSECCRVLRQDGLLVFTYHHSRVEGWLALARAVLGAGFSFVNAHPVKGEMSVATPKAQAKNPIQLDVIMVCRKRAVDHRSWQDEAACHSRALARSRAKAAELGDCSSPLSAGDRRVIVVSQFLVEACAQRSTEEAVRLLASHMPVLEDTLHELAPEASGAGAETQASQPQTPLWQLTLFDRGEATTYGTDVPTQDAATRIG